MTTRAAIVERYARVFLGAEIPAPVLLHDLRCVNSEGFPANIAPAIKTCMANLEDEECERQREQAYWGIFQ